MKLNITCEPGLGASGMEHRQEQVTFIFAHLLNGLDTIGSRSVGNAHITSRSAG